MTAAATLTAPAQLFSPESLSGALWGSLIGGVVGGDCYNGFSGEAAAIGAGVGLIAGAVAGEARRHYYSDPQPYPAAPTAAVSFGYGYGSCGSSAYVCYSPNAWVAPGDSYRAERPNYAVGGTLLGAASGALIGAGNEQAGKGAAIGAAAGLVIGSVAEAATRHREKQVAQGAQAAAPPIPQVPTEPVSTLPATQITSLDAHSQIQSRPCSTSSYYWTAPPQIPDAPRVPDAPRF
jgi:outer membrane lipoprotein SlyB